MSEKVDAFFLIYRNKVIKECDGLDYLCFQGVHIFKAERDAYYKERRNYEARINYQEKHPPKEIIENICECGGHYQTSQIKRHLKTKKHKIFFSEK